MKPDDLIENLASSAKAENPPEVDVSLRVMAALYNQAKRRRPKTVPLAWIAGVSAVAAGFMAVLSYAAWQAATDPLLGVFIDLYWGIL